MNPYLAVRKVIQAVSLVLLMAVFLYVIFRLMPGNPAQLFLFGARNGRASAQELSTLENQLGLSGGKWSVTGFERYMYDMFTFQFGYDYDKATPVWTLLSTALPYTLLLLGIATLIGYVVGIPLGVVATTFRGKRSEAGLVTTGLVLNSIPYFILAILLYLYFVVYFRLSPPSAAFPLSDVTSASWAHFVTVLTDLALPLTTLAVIEAGAYLLTMRAAMVSVLGEDFILTAKAKGVPEGSIMFRHAARNAMIPVSTRMALEFALVTSGAVITEIIYSYPGIGFLIYNAILNLDYPLAEGALFIISLIVILTYSALDFIHAWLDPRIRL